MEIEGKNVLVLGGGGMVGIAVCRLLLPYRPSQLVVASRNKSKARQAVVLLEAEFHESTTRIVPVWGDVFLRAEWRDDGAGARGAALADTDKRRRLTADILDPLDQGIVDSSLLVQLIEGAAPELNSAPAQIIVDCMNTATAVSYQDIFTSARRLAGLAAVGSDEIDWPAEVEEFMASLYVPQLVRHMQLLYEGMRRVGTEAYIKVGTSGTGGMGFNIPFTHGEEKPSRVLLSKSALAGAHSLLIFLLARTPGGPRVVKEIKPTALIGWRDIGYGTVGRGGQDVMLYDCPGEMAVSVGDDANLVAEGDFGKSTGEMLEGVYIDTGENGLFSSAEFTTITAPGLMRIVTPEEVAENVVHELVGGNTGRDVIAALDGSVMGPTYRAGYLRQVVLNRMRELEDEHGEAVAFEFLGPPRLSKLLYETYLLKRVGKTMDSVLAASANTLAGTIEHEVLTNADLRRRIVSIGIPILLADGKRLLRGPVMKSVDAYHGWVDLTAANIAAWQDRLTAIRKDVRIELEDEPSSRHDRDFTQSHAGLAEVDFLDLGEIVAWILVNEDQGRRGKS